MADPRAPERKPQRDPRPKKVYRTPRVLSQEKLEVVAATCTGPGAKDSPITCSIGPISS